MGEKVFVASEETLQIVKGTVEEIKTNLGTPDFGAGDTDVVALLKEIKTAVSVKEPYIEETYDSDGNLIDVKMHGYTKIRDNAFAACVYLALTSLPEGITEIGNAAFRFCNNLALTSLPAGIASIGGYAFGRCANLTNITFKGTPTSISSTAFDACGNLTVINVPWAEGEVAGAPWGATNATINYNYTE